MFTASAWKYRVFHFLRIRNKQNNACKMEDSVLRGILGGVADFM